MGNIKKVIIRIIGFVIVANFLYSRSVYPSVKSENALRPPLCSVEEERSIRAESPSQQSKTDKRYICDVTTDPEFRTILVEDNIYRFLCNLIRGDKTDKETLARTILQGYLSVIPESELKRLPLELRAVGSFFNELARYNEKEDVIFIRLSTVTVAHPKPIMEIDWTICHERIHLEVERLDSNIKTEIYRAINASKHAYVVCIRQISEWHYPDIKNNPTGIASESLSCLGSLYSKDREKVRLVIKEAFSEKLQQIIIGLFEKTQPSDEELLHIKNVANQMVGKIDFKSKTISESL